MDDDLLNEILSSNNSIGSLGGMGGGFDIDGPDMSFLNSVDSHEEPARNEDSLADVDMDAEDVTPSIGMLEPNPNAVRRGMGAGSMGGGMGGGIGGMGESMGMGGPLGSVQMDIPRQRRTRGHEAKRKAHLQAAGLDIGDFDPTYGLPKSSLGHSIKQSSAKMSSKHANTSHHSKPPSRPSSKNSNKSSKVTAKVTVGGWGKPNTIKISASKSRVSSASSGLDHHGQHKHSSKHTPRSQNPIKLILRKLGPKRFRLLRVEGLTQEEARKSSSIRFANKTPFGDVPRLEPDPRLPFVKEASNFSVMMFSLQSHTPTLKILAERSRKSLDNLSLEELSRVMLELQDTMRDAKRRGKAIRQRLLKLKPSIVHDENFKSSAQLLDMIQEVDLSDTLRASQEAMALEVKPPTIVSSKPEPVTVMEEEKEVKHGSVQKKKDKKARSRCPSSSKALWDSWETFWKYPSSANINNILKIRPLPPFPPGTKNDPAFDVPELGPHYSLSDQEKADYRLSLSRKAFKGAQHDSSAHALSHRVLCGMLFDEEMNMTKKQHFDPAIRSILTGLCHSDWSAEQSSDVFQMPVVTPLEPNGSKSKAKLSQEQRVSQELLSIEDLNIDSDVFRALAARKDTKLYLQLRDRQVRLFKQLEKNNQWRRRVLKAVAKAGVSLDVEKKLGRLKEAYDDLYKVYKAYKKKGFFATQMQIVKALSNVAHVKAKIGTRADLTGFDVDPRTVDGIPRYEMDK
ncbi:hypothetical protein AAMO2058_001281300 [Amorphochlora amoebiformis]